MITFPLFTELEKHRDEANENFHRNIRPQLVERLKTFGFVSISEDVTGLMQLQEQLRIRFRKTPFIQIIE